MTDTINVKSKGITNEAESAQNVAFSGRKRPAVALVEWLLIACGRDIVVGRDRRGIM